MRRSFASSPVIFTHQLEPTYCVSAIIVSCFSSNKQFKDEQGLANVAIKKNALDRAFVDPLSHHSIQGGRESRAFMKYNMHEV